MYVPPTNPTSVPTTVSKPLHALDVRTNSAMVEDEERGRLRSFYVTPASRLNLSLGYILSAWCSGMVICLITLAAGEGYFALKGHPLLRASDIAALVGVIALNVFTFSAIGYLIALFVRQPTQPASIYDLRC